MQQQGGSASVLYRLDPTFASLRVTGTLAHLKPYRDLEEAPVFVGPQKTNLLSFRAALALNLWDTSFYLAREANPQGSWLGWNTQMLLGGGKFDSVFGHSTNSIGEDSGLLDYYNVNGALTSTFSYDDYKFIFNTKASTTQGTETFFLQEYYSPYQTFILGSTPSLSYASFPIVDRGSLFDLRAGAWSYLLAGALDFPLYKPYESTFLIAYLNDWRGQFGVNYGGVALNNNFSDLSSVLSLSTSMSMAVDVKGFVMHPSLIYSWIPESGSWSLLIQFNFMNLL
jgi:hypothetical protein